MISKKMEVMSFLQEATSNYGVAKPRLWWNQYNPLEGAKLTPHLK